jgi:5-methylcytosine-specific restriction endonuclease McrA
MRTLVLDQGYQPHRIVSWQKGIALFFRGKVDVLEEYEDEVRTVSSAYRLPAVVRLRVPVPFRVQRIRFSRLNVLRRDGFACQYCGQEGGSKDLTIDHVVPKARGGLTAWANVVTACRPCNQRKGDRVLARSGLTWPSDRRRPRGCRRARGARSCRALRPSGAAGVWSPHRSGSVTAPRAARIRACPGNS